MFTFKNTLILCFLIGFGTAADSNSEFEPLRKFLMHEIKEKNLEEVISVIEEAKSGNINISALINNWVEIEPIDWGTPLHQATSENSLSIVKFLVEKGADINQLVRSPSDSLQYCTPLEIAVMINSVDIVKYLLNNNASTSLQQSHTFREKEIGFEKPPLHIAAVLDSPEMILLILEHGGDVNVKDKRGDTPLIDALRSASLETASTLINSGADTNTVNDFTHQSALHVAVYSKEEAKVNLLIQKGAKIDHQDKNGDTPLSKALFDRSFNIAKILLKHGARLEPKYLTKYPDCPYDAVKVGDVEMVEIFLKAGADVSVKSEKNEYTPLHAVAFAKKNIEPMIELLLKYKADLRLKSKDGKTPLDLAIQLKNQEAVNVFKKVGSD